MLYAKTSLGLESFFFFFFSGGQFPLSFSSRLLLSVVLPHPHSNLRVGLHVLEHQALLSPCCPELFQFPPPRPPILLLPLAHSASLFSPPGDFSSCHFPLHSLSFLVQPLSFSFPFFSTPFQSLSSSFPFHPLSLSSPFSSSPFPHSPQPLFPAFPFLSNL